ncbi:MAG: hypothetical protein SH818_01630, partial [Saprospiraceae bacterium]|nr:hypothetical protein [Saprospiraceae bacterium]
MVAVHLLPNKTHLRIGGRSPTTPQTIFICASVVAVQLLPNNTHLRIGGRSPTAPKQYSSAHRLVVAQLLPNNTCGPTAPERFSDLYSYP